MRIASVELQNFKRFEHLSITGIPASARFVVLAGPNGKGKSSLFDAFRVAGGLLAGYGYNQDADYYERRPYLGAKAPMSLHQTTSVLVSGIKFHGTDAQMPRENLFKSFYFRSAYRHQPEMAFHAIERQSPLRGEKRVGRMIDNDLAVGTNYQRLVAAVMESAFEKDDPAMSLGAWRDQAVGDLREAMRHLFPDLVLNSLGNIMSDVTFRFSKGDMTGFAYKNLSGGERAAFDLLLDIFVKRHFYDDTIYCIDEPEAHINPKLHGPMLAELDHMIPENCQLWVATHSIGMMRYARNMETDNPGSVAFLDFDREDFDKPVDMAPVRPTRAFWSKVLSVALDDLADLVAPSELVVCEGDPGGANPSKNADHDARCYMAIFGDEMPDVAFVSGGNSHDVVGDQLGIGTAFPAAVKGTNVRRLIDRDDHAPSDVADFEKKGINVLGRRNIEDYLYDDEVLRLLCDARGRPDAIDGMLAAKQAAMRASVERGNPADDLRKAASDIYGAARTILRLTGTGNDARAFERNVLAPLITPNTAVYSELRNHIFGTPLGRGTQA